MKKYSHLRERVRSWRSHGLSLTDIQGRLPGVPKGTIYYWIRDLPLQRRRKGSNQKAVQAAKRKYQILREKAFSEGEEEAPTLLQESTLRDFVVLYLAEGYRRNRNQVAIGNSNPQIVVLSHRVVSRFTSRKVSHALQYHCDQDPDSVRCFWGGLLSIAPETISLQRKSNSGGLSGRKWRSEHGVLTVRTNDTYFRARLEAWMEYIQSTW